MADKKISMLYGLLTSIASKITYDNTTSGLTADNVQDAIDETKNDADSATYYRPGDRIWICENGTATKNCSTFMIGFCPGDPSKQRYKLMLNKNISPEVTSATLHVEGGNARFDCYANQNGVPTMQVDGNWGVILGKDNLLLVCGNTTMISGSFTASNPFYMPILRSGSGETPTTCNIYVELT